METDYTYKGLSAPKLSNEEAGRVRYEQSLLEKQTHELGELLARLRDRLDPVLLPTRPEVGASADTAQPEPNRSSVAQQTHFIAGLVSDACANVDDLLRRLDV